MAVDDLPMPLVNFLNVIGVEWPYLNEDTLMQFASVVREFGQAVGETHQDATATVTQLASAYKSAAYDQLHNRWAEMSSAHVSELVTACTVVADAFELAAAYVVEQKVMAIGELVGMAATFFADQAAAVATLGLAEAAVPVIIEAAKKVGESLIQELEQYLIGKLAGDAVKPLIAKVESAMVGLQWPGGGGAPAVGVSFEVDTQAMQTHANALRAHADTMAVHTQTFKAKASSISFS